jgi:hypothetical protein
MRPPFHREITLMRKLFVPVVAGAFTGCMHAPPAGSPGAPPSAVHVPGAAIPSVAPFGRTEAVETRVVPVPRVERSKEGMLVMVPDTSRVVPMPTVRPPNRDPGIAAWPGNELTITIRGSATVQRDTGLVLPDSLFRADAGRLAPPAAPTPESSPSRP